MNIGNYYQPQRRWIVFTPITNAAPFSLLHTDLVCGKLNFLLDDSLIMLKFPI